MQNLRTANEKNYKIHMTRIYLGLDKAMVKLHTNELIMLASFKKYNRTSQLPINLYYLLSSGACLSAPYIKNFLAIFHCHGGETTHETKSTQFIGTL